MIAEAWDAAGLYQVGSFVGDSWKEWNGRFRTMRGAFSEGRGFGARFADRLIGSPEIYGHEEREPEQSVNFVTCHDGFTLNDLVSYDRSTTRRMVRTTGMAQMTTEAGTAAPRVRPMMPRWRSCETGR